MSNSINKIEIRDARVARRNFRGEERRFGNKVMNSAGNRNFLLILPDDIVGDCISDGWNVKQFKPSEDGTPGDYFINVKVNFSYKPPVVWLVTRKDGKPVRTKLDEDTIGELDYADIIEIKLVVKPVIRTDEYSGKTTVSAYLETMYCEVENSDPFADDEEW